MSRRPPIALCVVLLAALAALVPTGTQADSTSTRTIALPPVAVSGYLQLDHRQAFNGSRRHDFAIRRARLTLSGKAHERVGFNLTLQGDRPGATQFALLDAYADVALVRGWSLRAGQNKYEFDIEGREADDRNPAIDRSWAANAVAGAMLGDADASRPTASFRDRGLGLIGETRFAGIDWNGAVGVYQGQGRETDADNDVGYTLRLRLKRGGATVNYGWLSNPVESSFWPENRYLYSAWTAGIDHVWRRHHLRAEVYEGQRDYGGSDGETQGAYLLEVVRVHPMLDASARWQTLRMLDYFGPRASGVDVGARLWFVRDGTRSNTWLAFNWMVREAGVGAAAWLTTLNDGAGSFSFPADRQRSLVVARLQVAY